jgi:PDDEXK-like domain of unknown function (DUF3799)
MIKSYSDIVDSAPFVIVQDDKYYSRGEISNSDLGTIEKLLSPPQWVIDSEKAFRFGTLFDAVVTEPENINYYTREIGSYTYTADEFAIANEMFKMLKKDPLGLHFVNHADRQVQMVRELNIAWDIFNFKAHGWGGDLKSTAATTQEQFFKSCQMFHYDRSRALYMDIAGSDRDIIIGVSKKEPYNVFKIPIVRGDALYESGKAKYSELAYKYKIMFD